MPSAADTSSRVSSQVEINTPNTGSETQRSDIQRQTDVNLMKAYSMIPYAHQLSESRLSHRNETAAARKKRSKKKKSPISANLSGTRYEVVRQMVEQVGFYVSKDDDSNSYLIWNDSFVSTDRISELKPFQRINHFPGMGEICRKDCLARNMAKMNKVHPEDYSFVPHTWIFPSEFNAFQNYARELKKKKKHRTFIYKPANGAMGNGIALYRNPEKIPQADHVIVQEYLDKPFLIDGYKCDLRIYVLVTSCDPLRIFLFNDGLVRMSTEKYVAPTDTNIEHQYMHLTNYSVNKHSEGYEKSQSVDTGSKRTLKFLNDYLRKNDYPVAQVWKSITDVIIKTMIVAEPHVLHAYRMCRPGQAPGSDSVCFEILGFDIMLDRKLRPWLLEINRSPSFGTDEQLDYDIKSGVLHDTLKLINIKASDKKRNLAAQKAESQRRLFQQPTRKSDIVDLSDLEKRKMSVERRKEELRELLNRIRKDASREDFENRNSGRFRRIFPPDDKYSQEKYATLLSDAFNTFLSGRATSLQKEIARTYNNKLREEDVLDMLAQCEADERDGKPGAGGRYNRGPAPMTSMPASRMDAPIEKNEDDSESDEYGEYEEDTASKFSGSISQRRSRPPSVYQNGVGSRPVSGRPLSASRSAVSSRPGTSQSQRPGTGQRSRSLTRPISASNRLNGTASQMDEINRKEQEEELCRRTLVALNEMRIKFPGKTDEEAEWILDKIHENWKFHKPRIASYWLVKLDSIKRRKVIDIVRSNVRAVLQRTWRSPDVDSLRLYRIYSRVFNRLLWSHGQGLWNCFTTAGNSWETIFSKSTEVITATEMDSCRRIVQLCRDCLLIVYQFASDAKALQTSQQTPQQREQLGDRPSMFSHTERKQPVSWSPNHTVSHRISRLYTNRPETLQN